MRNIILLSLLAILSNPVPTVSRGIGKAGRVTNSAADGKSVENSGRVIRDRAVYSDQLPFFIQVCTFIQGLGTCYFCCDEPGKGHCVNISHGPQGAGIRPSQGPREIASRNSGDCPRPRSSAGLSINLRVARLSLCVNVTV